MTGEPLSLYDQDISEAVWESACDSDRVICVEVTPLEGGFAFRDSKLPNSPVLRFTKQEVQEMLSASSDLFPGITR